tara:strand:+ start:724 stop:990 length:267 start_codon:yes stop_codon:yes gene_type:complete
MGKLTIKEVQDLKEQGILDNKAIKELESKKLVGTRNRGSKYFIENNKTKVYPSLYFRNLGKGTTQTDKLKNFRSEFNKLLEKYATKEQ